MKELDLMLAGWVSQRFELASAPERTQFLALLELPDPDLVRYLLAGEPPASPELAAAVDQVRASAGIMSGNLAVAPEPSATPPL
jgi:succinate dehydrogenase flavin-adding protein (antitoxin of CptAB toxin-antitoxin module)